MDEIQNEFLITETDSKINLLNKAKSPMKICSLANKKASI